MFLKVAITLNVTPVAQHNPNEDNVFALIDMGCPPIYTPYSIGSMIGLHKL